MNDLTVFKTPSGDEMVVLDRRRYDDLLAAEEMMQDIAAYDRAKAQLANGREELVPSAVVDALLAGESPLKIWRLQRGLTQAELAKEASLSISYISNIETGARQGTLYNLGKLAAVLGLNLDDLA